MGLNGLQFDLIQGQANRDAMLYMYKDGAQLGKTIIDKDGVLIPHALQYTNTSGLDWSFNNNTLIIKP